MSDALPPGWAQTSIGAVVAERVEQSPPAHDTEFTYVDISSIDTRRKSIVSPKTLAGSTAPSRAKQRLRTRDVLVSMTRPNLNAVALVPEGLNESVGSTGFDVLRARGAAPGWLYYLVQTNAFIDSMSMLVQGALYPAVRPKDIRGYEITLPPLAEQHRIVAAIEEHLSRLDAAVTALERVKALLPRYRAAVLKAAVDGRLVPEGATVPSELSGELPLGWQSVALGDIGELQGGIQKQPKRRPVKNKYPFLRVANVGRGILDLQEIHEIELFGHELERLRLETGDLLIVEGNGSPGEIGRMAIWDGSIPDCVHQNHLIRHRPGKQVRSSWIQAYWNSPTGRMRVLQVASSTSGLYTLSVRKVAGLPIPLPPLDQQDSIVAEVDRLSSLIGSAESAAEMGLARAAALRQSILAQAFRGELVPQDPDDEPAEVLLERIRAEWAGVVPPGKSPRVKRVAQHR